MANTELYQLPRAERLKKIGEMETDLLFAELDDTIQFDMMKMSNQDWLTFAEKKVYTEIMYELRDRIDRGAGRKKKEFDYEEYLRLREKGFDNEMIALQMKIGIATLYRRLAEQKRGQEEPLG